MTATTIDTAALSGKLRMDLLCQAFPSLRRAPRWEGLPTPAIAFARWASGPRCTHAGRQAAAFALSVWNGGTPDDGGWWNEGKYRVGRFDVVEAFSSWDQAHRAAFLSWCNGPFWP